MTRVNFVLLLFCLFLTVSAASDRLRADDENLSICQFVTVLSVLIMTHITYIMLWSGFSH